MVQSICPFQICQSENRYSLGKLFYFLNNFTLVGFSVDGLHHERFHEKFIEEPPQVHTTSPTSTMLEHAVQFGPTSTLVESPGKSYCCMNECHFIYYLFSNEAYGKKNTFRHPEKEGTFLPLNTMAEERWRENTQSNVNPVTFNLM
jgi:hypothetical protein